MEQKRVLWIVAAVGLFLLVSIGTALIIYHPAKNQTPVLNSQAGSVTWTRESPASSQSATPAQPAAPVQADVPAEASASDASAQVTNLTVISANTNVISEGTKTIDLNAISKNTQSDAAPASSTETAVKKTSSAPAEKTTASTPAKSNPVTSSVKTVTSKVPDQFWVQAASFTKKVNAEEARDALAAEKIPGEVFTWKDVNGVVYYRLRVGPYTTKSEADFWLSRIKEISAFATASSYVVNSSEKAID